MTPPQRDPPKKTTQNTTLRSTRVYLFLSFRTEHEDRSRYFPQWDRTISVFDLHWDPTGQVQLDGSGWRRTPWTGRSHVLFAFLREKGGRKRRAWAWRRGSPRTGQRSVFLRSPCSMMFFRDRSDVPMAVGFSTANLENMSCWLCAGFRAHRFCL